MQVRDALRRGLLATALLAPSVFACSAATEPALDGASRPTARGAPPPVAPKPRRHVELHVYAMSMCPYAAKFIKGVAPLREHFDLRVKVDYVGTVGTNGDLSSMRGPPELTGDLYGVCAQTHAPKWLDALLCQAEDLSSVSTSWAACARKTGTAEEAIERVEACVAGDEGRALLTTSFASARGRGASASPTIFVDGETYDGPRGPRGFVKEICSRWMTQPEACRAIPPLEVTVLSDATCVDCKQDILVKLLEGRLDGAEIVARDVSSPEGAKLYAELGAANVPAVVVDADANLGADADLFHAAKRVGSHLYYSTGDWNPACNAPGGCALAECAPRLSCRTEEPLTLDLYMMGLCPFAAKGILALGEVFDQLVKAGQHPRLRVHFIGKESLDELSSMHGPKEVEEDLRDACVVERYATDTKFLAYLRCRAADFKADWRTCTGGSTGFDAGVIESCATGTEGKTLLKASFASSDAEGIIASPTWIANARYKFSGVTRDVIEAAFCRHNEGVVGCGAATP